MSEFTQIEVDSLLLKSVLDEARNTVIGDFNAEQLGWLEENCTLANVAVRGFRSGEEQALAMLGVAVGIHVVRKHIDSAQTDLPEVLANHREHYFNKKLVDGEEIESERLHILFGPDAGSTIAEIKHPKVRTLSALMLITSLGNEATPETDSFIKSQKHFKRRPARRFVKTQTRHK